MIRSNVTSMFNQLRRHLHGTRKERGSRPRFASRSKYALNDNLPTFDGRENERLLNSEPERFYRSKSDRPLSPDPERVISAELLSNSYL